MSSLAPTSREDIVDAQLYVNRTALYLSSIVNTFPDNVKVHIKNIQIIAWGINDLDYLSVGRNPTRRSLLFFLVDYRKSVHAIENVERALDVHSLFHDSYFFNLRGDQILKMLVVKVPKRWDGAFDKFKQGEFSKMFTRQELTSLRIPIRTRNNLPNPVYEVLTHSPEYRAAFVERMRKIYGASLNPDDLPQNIEYDSFHINPTVEIFNGDPGKPEI